MAVEPLNEPDASAYRADLAELLELIPLPATLLDGEGFSVSTNQAYCDKLGLDRDDIGSRELGDAIHPEDLEKADAVIARSKIHGTAEENLRLRHGAGHYFDIHWTLLHRPEADGYLAIASDRTTERTRLAEAQARARTDELTGLLSRAGLMDELAASHDAHPSGGLVVALFDIDGFKKLNDTLGHQAGDRVLQIIAGRLRRAVPAKAAVGRLGGDEFVIICPRGTVDVLQIGPVIELALSEPLSFHGNTFDVHASIGAYCSQPGDAVNALLRNADIAVYEAKRQGRQRWCVATPELIKQWETTRSVEQQLANALGTGQFLPHFQPIVNVSTRRIEAFETLLRWQTPDGRIQPAASFLETASNAQLLPRMSAEVRQQALRLPASLPRVGLSINASSTELLARGFRDELQALAQINDIDTSRIIVEVTEQTALDDIDLAGRVLDELRNQGFVIALDDFGSGYSSLTYLTELPIDVVKLDGAFLRAAQASPRGRQVLEGIVDFLHRIDLVTVIECVETEDDHDLACDVGIELAQGWLYGRPVAAAEAIDAVLTEGKNAAR